MDLVTLDPVTFDKLSGTRLSVLNQRIRLLLVASYRYPNTFTKKSLPRELTFLLSL